MTSSPVAGRSSSQNPPVKLHYADPKESDKAYGAKLMLLDGGHLELGKEGKKVLARCSESEFLNLCFIFGNARSGKSFIMNCLAGVPHLFQVINSAMPCTRGVEISSFLSSYAALATHVGIATKDNVKELKKAPKLGFVDVEGQGAEDGTYDTLLALPLLLTSKVVLFNHKGAPTVSDMLSKLGVLASAANYVEVPEEKEDPGMFGKLLSSKPQTVTEAEGKQAHPTRKKFGHLHVLFRDFTFTGTREEVFEQLLGFEKPKKSIQSAAHDKAVKERNDIRQLLLDNFESINVWLFKQPATADDLSSHEELPAELVDPEFVQTVFALLKTIVAQAREPTLFQGKPLTGPRLSLLLQQICNSLNDGGLINVPSVFRAMEKETVNRICADAFTEFKDVVGALQDALPMAKDKLENLLMEAKNVALNRFDHDLKDNILDEDKATKREELISQVAELSEHLLSLNVRAISDRLHEVVDTEMEKVRLEFAQYCDEMMPLEDSKQLDQTFLRMADEAHTNIKDLLNDLPQVFESSEFHEYLDEVQARLLQFVNLKKAENESLLKDAAIERLRAQAMKQQETLIDKNKQLERYLDDEKKNTRDMENQLLELKKEKDDELRRTAEYEAQIQKTKNELETLKRKRYFFCSIL